MKVAELKDHIGEEMTVSEWVTVTQDMINQFAECTLDDQWIHVDVDRAKAQSPFKNTIAHGYLTLSLVAGLSMKAGGGPTDVAAGLNYGLDKVRFLSPVVVGSKVRLRTELADVTPKGPGQYLVKNKATIEIEGADKPAMIAETLAMLIAAPS